MVKPYALIVSVALSLVSCRPKPQEPPQGGGMPAPVFAVTLGTVVRAPITQTTQLTGTVKWPKRATLSTEIQGTVVVAPPANGSRVAKGDLLLQLDRTDLERTIQRQRAELGRARANLQVLTTPTRPETMDQLRAIVAQAEARVAQFNEEHIRVKKLVENAIRPGSDLTRAVADLTAAKAIVRQHQAALLEAENGATEAEIAVAASAVQVAEATVGEAEGQLQKAQLLAPFSGIVQRRQAEQGTVVSPGAPLLELASDGNVEIHVAVPERSVGVVRAGQELSFRADAFPARTFAARVTSILPDGDERSRTYSLQAAVLEPAGLLPRMFVRLSMPVETVDDAILVPKDAITYKEDKATVFTVTEGVAQPVPVELGATANGLVAVQGELREGMTVVTTGGEVLFPGAKVMNTAKPAVASPAGETPE